MTLAALPADVERIWWITLAVGLVVAVIVVVLLQLLLNAVRLVRRNVDELWHTATTVARNTATTWQLNQTADSLDVLKAEALRHDALLAEVASGRRRWPSRLLGGGSR